MTNERKERYDDKPAPSASERPKHTTVCGCSECWPVNFPERPAPSASDTTGSRVRPPFGAFDAAYEETFTQYARDKNDQIEDETIEAGDHHGIFGTFDLELIFDAGWNAALRSSEKRVSREQIIAAVEPFLESYASPEQIADAVLALFTEPGE